MKSPIVDRWCDTDVWIDGWWLRTPQDQMFFVHRPQSERNLALWLTCLRYWDQPHPNPISFPPLASFEVQLHPLVLIIQELP